MADKAQAPPAGVEWPITSGNERGTTETNQRAFAAATRVADEAAADAMLKERGWRHRYDRHVLSHVKAFLKSPKAAIDGSKAGLEYLHNTFEFYRDGEKMSVASALQKYTGTCETGVIKGQGSRKDFELPYKGRTLRGQEIIDQCNKWAAKGVMESDAAEAIIGVVKNKNWQSLEDKVFVLMGAGAAMGPFLTLMAMGANVVAVDVDIPAIWDRLFATAQNSAGTFTFPLKKPQNQCASNKELSQFAGGNLITSFPEIANWIVSLYPAKQLVLGSYVYLDSAMFVKVSVACDAIMQKVLEKRKDTAIAMLGTPTDVYVIPEQARVAAEANHSLSNWKNLVLLPLKPVAFLANISLKKQILAPNYGRAVVAENSDRFYLCEGITVPQGPNYILSKRMQQWRCMLARERGHVVSFNVAPATRTISVLKNKQFAWAYDGMGFFPAVEIFDQETSNPVMAALLLADLANANSAANPKNALRNPQELFAKTAIHGGAWRMPYKFNSVGEVAVLIYFVKTLKLPLIVLFLLFIFYLFFLR